MLSQDLAESDDESDAAIQMIEKKAMCLKSLEYKNQYKKKKTMDKNIG